MPFIKGQSGNPGGMRKGTGVVISLALDLSVRAVQRLGELVESEDGHVAVAACKALLDRGLGKPKEHVTVDGAVRIETLVADLKLARERAKVGA